MPDGDSPLFIASPEALPEAPASQPLPAVQPPPAAVVPPRVDKAPDVRRADDAAARARVATRSSDDVAAQAQEWQSRAETAIQKLEATEHRATLSEIASDRQMSKQERELLTDMAPVGMSLDQIEARAAKILAYRESVTAGLQQQTQAQIEEARAAAAQQLNGRARNAPPLPPTPPAKKASEMSLEELTNFGMQGGFVQQL